MMRVTANNNKAMVVVGGTKKRGAVYEAATITVLKVVDAIDKS